MNKRLEDFMLAHELCGDFVLEPPSENDLRRAAEQGQGEVAVRAICRLCGQSVVDNLDPTVVIALLQPIDFEIPPEILESPRFKQLRKEMERAYLRAHARQPKQ